MGREKKKKERDGDGDGDGGNYVIRGIKTTTFLHINLSLLKFPLVHSKAVPQNRLRMCIIK